MAKRERHRTGLELLELLGLEGTATQPLSKRLRTDEWTGGLDPAAETFLPGSIIRVKVRNFTTYLIAEFHLGPALNMIIGPNGTGKSTLVAAICMGLGGRPELISRLSVKLMIKTGEQEAMVEVELKRHAGERNAVVCRVFGARGLKYTLDGEDVLERTVKRLCSDLNIQLDNLCQFLPQERVAQFAAMQPEQLLKEVERSVGGGELLVQHEQLIDLFREKTTQDELVAKSQEAHDELQRQRATLEEAAQSYERFQQLKADHDVHLKVLPYARYQDKMEHLKELKQKREEAKRALAEFKENKRPFEDEREQQRREEAKHELRLERAQEQLEKHKLQMDRHLKRAEEVVAEVEKERENKVHLEQRFELRRKKLEELKEKREASVQALAKYQQQVEAWEGIEDTKAEVARLEQVLEPAQQEFDDLRQQLRIRQARIQGCSDQLAKIERQLTLSDKIGVLDHQRDNVAHQRAKNAHLRLRQSPQFAGKYHECPLVTVDVVPQRYARYVEAIVDNNTAIALTVTNDADLEELSSRLFTELRVNVPVRLVGQQLVQLPMTQDEVRAYGFDGFLVDFVQGPESVVRMLCEHLDLHRIPVAARPLLDEQLAVLLEPDTTTGQLPFMKFILGDQLVTFNRSRYGQREVFYKATFIRDAKVFGVTGILPLRKQELEQRREAEQTRRAQFEEERTTLEAQAQAAEARVREVKQEYQKVRDEVKVYAGLQNLVQKYTLHVENEAKMVEKLEEQCAHQDPEQLARYDQRVAELLRDQLVHTAHAGTAAVKVSDAEIEVSRQQFVVLDAHNRVVLLQGLLDIIDKQKALLEEAFSRARQAYSDAKAEDLSALRAQRDQLTREERELVLALVTRYLEAHELSEAEVLRKIARIKLEMEMFTHTLELALTRLQRNVEEMDRLEMELPRLQDQAQRLASEIQSVVQVWEPAVDALVAQVLETFAGSFTRVATAGEVRVFKAPDYKDWRLEIMVKFRDNLEFAPLDLHVQSGGERAVSTVFFMMALQGLTLFPFRVVDEINQGMDARNEKIVHRYLVEHACSGSVRLQYFLVTPKLLQGLYYDKSMRLHCLVMGAFHEAVEDNPRDLLYGDTGKYVAAA